MAEKYGWRTEQKEDEERSYGWREESSSELAATIGSNITSRVNTWLKNHNTYLSNYQSRYGNRKYDYQDAYVHDSADWLSTVSKQKSNFDAEADSILELLEQNKGMLDEDWVKSIQETLTGARNQQKVVLDYSTKDNEWWSNFKDESEYQTNQRYDSYSKKYTGKKYEDIQAAFEALEDGEEKEWLTYNQYELYKKDGNYTSRAASGYKSYEAQKTAELEKEANKKWWERVAEDFAYSSADTSLPAATLSNVTNAYRNDTSYKEPNDEWSEDAKQHFGYLYSVNPQSAYTFAEQMNNQINAQKKYEQQQSVQANATKSGWSMVGNTIGAIATAPLGLADYLDDLAEYSARGTITQKGMITPFEYGQAAQSGVANKLNEYGTMDEDAFLIGGKGWGDVYSLGVSTANSLISAYTLGGAGTMVNFIGQGGAAGVDDALSRGATPDQALLYGTIVGALEGATEFLPADQLIKAGSSSTLKNFMLKALQQGVGEFFEEGTSSLLGNVADNFIMKEKSNFNNLVKELMEADPTLSKEEATQIAWKRTARDIAFDAVGGFASGVASSTISGGVTTALDARAGKQENIDAVKQYGGVTGDLIQEGLQSDPKSESYQLAEKYQKKTEKGKELTGFQIRNLLAANQEQVTPKDMKLIQQAAEKRLTELGQTKDVAKVAELATKWATGGKLTRSQKNFLASSEYGSRVANELHPKNIASDDFSTDWAEHIGTRQVNAAAYNKAKIREVLEAMATAEDQAAYKPLEDRVGTEARFNVAESGEATVRATGKKVDLENFEVTKLEDGEMTIKAEGGEEVYAGDIDFANEDQAYAFSAVADIENITPAAATAMVKAVDYSKPVGAQLNGLDEAYTYGYYGYSEADLKAGDFTGNLTSEQMMSAYKLGQSARKIGIQAQGEQMVKMRTAKEATVSKKEKTTQQKARFESDDTEVYFMDGSSVTKFDEAGHQYDETRMAGVNTAKFLSKLGIGKKYYFYESYVNAEGKRVYKDANGNEVDAPNGLYKAADGSIYIDLNAGNEGQGTTLFTLGHELGHFIKQWSPQKFQVLADFLVEEYGKTDMTMRERVLEKQSQLEKIRGEKVSYDEAFEEVVADAMSTMFADGKLHEKLAKLKAKDKSLFNKIKQFIDNLVAKFRDLYATLTPDQKDAQDVREMKDAFDRIQTAFAEALVEASDNLQASESALAQAGISVDASTDAGSIYSVRDVLSEADRKKVTKALVDRFGVTTEEAKAWLKAETSLASLILNPKYSAYLDYEGDPNEVAIKQNSDYPQGTVDFSNICKKRREFTQVMNSILRNFPNHVFAATDLAKIRTIMGEEGMTLPCGICYVEDRRQLDTIVAQDFINSLKLYREGSKTRPDGKPFNANQLKGLQLTDGDTYVPTIYELVSLEGRNSLKVKNPNMEAAWVRFNNARGMQAVRLLTNEAEYKRQILKYSKSTVKSKNDRGGLRIYSFSDAEMFHLIDIIQVITDSAAVGLSLQGYTKVNEYAKAVKDTGEKLNRSLIPKGDLGYHMENGKVVLDYDTVEGIDIYHKDFFDNKDNPNVGNITIGINDVQIRASMVSDFVDQIIPFHTGQSEEVLGEKGIAAWDNYKDSQTEKDLATGKTSSHQINIYTEVFQAAEDEGKPIQNKRQFVEKFLQVCKENGLQPRFAQFLNTDANGDYVYTEGYHKFLVDFKTFAQTEVGEYLPQMPVKPIFDDAYITGLLEAYVEEQQAKDAEVAKQMPKVIKRITNEIVKPGVFMHSDRIQEGYDTRNLAWAIENGIIDESDQARFWEAIAEIQKLNYNSFARTKNGGYIIETANKMMFTDGDYKAPTLSKVIVFPYGEFVDTSNERTMIRNEARNTGRTNQSTAIIENLYGPGFVTEYYTPRYRADGRSIGQGERTHRSGSDSESGSRGVRHEETDGLQPGQKISRDFLADDQLKGNYKVSEISEMFDAWNSDPDTAKLAKKVFAKLQEIQDNLSKPSTIPGFGRWPLPIRFKSEAYMQKEFYTAPHGVFAARRNDTNYGITYNLDYFKSVSDQEKAHVLLHEAIHACTIGAIAAAERLIPQYADPMEITPGENWSEQVKAGLTLIQTFSQVRVANGRDNNEYGQKSVYEMVAEMSNPEFRGMLKKQRLWGRIVDAIKHIFGIGNTTAYDAVSDALERILELDIPKAKETIRRSERTNAPVFYSQMGKVVEGMKQEKFGASSVISMLRGRGVKAEEIRWSGIQAFLDGKKSVTKAELLEFIKGSMLHIEEETRGGNTALDDFAQEWLRLMDYDSSAVEDLVVDDQFIAEAEEFLRAAVDEGNLEQDEMDLLLELAQMAKGGGKPTKWDTYKLDGGENYRELVFKMPGSTYTNRAMKGHWGRDAHGILAHARMQDFNTFIGKMLFIEEIQSDWHNEGHRSGYGETMSAEERKHIKNDILKKFVDSDVGKDIVNKTIRYWGLYSEADAHKMIADDPANVGAELIAMYPYWMTEERTAAIINLQEQFDKLDRKKAPDAPFKDNYHEYVLKRLLRMAAEEGYDSIGWTTADIQSDRWSDDYAEGYRIEYDQDMPKFLKKYGKQWGTTVGKTVLDNGKEVWSMAITDSMQKSVLEEGQVMYSERTGDSVSNRSMLANAFEGITQNSEEYKLIQEYKGQIKMLNKLEEQLSDTNAEIRKLTFGTEGARDMNRLQELRDKAKRLAHDINRHDKRLLSLEASEPLRRVVERERVKASKKTKDHVAEIQQNKKLRAEQTELRHKIRKTIRDLDKILNRGNKKLNVKEDVQNVVTKALQAADILFTDNYGNYDILRNGIKTDLSDAEEALVNTCTRMLKDLDKMPTGGYDNFQARQEAENRLRAKMSGLKEVFARERKRLNNTTVSSILNDLAEAYASLEKSEQSYVQGAYSEAVHNYLKSLQSEVGGTIVHDMTKNQLESLYAAYKMVLTTVRKANQMFNEELKQSREQLGNAVIQEVMSAGGVHGLWTKAELKASEALWNNMKPVWVANRIGSDTFGKLMKGLFKGQYNFAVDIDEAKQFKLKMDEKYHPRSWDTEKLYQFNSSTGKEFSMDLQQIMSLYAYSKRAQSYSHLLNGGFVFEGNSTVIVDKKGIKRTYIHNGATSYKLNEATLNGIINTLSAEQKAYVDEMQKYLSETMGAKGNEVSMELYGIKMFNEQFYFPLRSSGAYLERAKEAELKKQQGQINLVNSGFTHSVKPEAKNPVILSGFADVWAEHCNEMSMYHSMVLPMEDFRKVYNYSTVHDDKFDSASVFQTIQDAYGSAATNYIDQLYRELNAGATIDPRETPFKARISKFKKAAVMLSGSVVVQQFSSIGRAYAIIDPKYFIGTKVNTGTQLSSVDEMKKYAPVAIIKEMGGFDTGTKGSAKSYILAEKYGKGERIKGIINDEQYRGDLMGYLPAKADEKTWGAIWEAAKRETKAKHPKVDVRSEEFLKLAAELFSETIEKTQVYDSVLARSANMRSKGAFMTMATAFMAEPTTTINLLEDAIRGGNAKQIARAFGAVAVSIVLNNALASIVYAMRDDDEDETFIEKYFQSFASGMIDDINPMSYYPFLKDVYSLFQGYDVERADMSVIADVRDALKKTISIIGKDTSDMDEKELAEHHKQVYGVFLSLLDAVCSAFGVPIKNVRRDVTGIINAYTTVRKDATERDTTWDSFWDKVGAAAKDTIPIYAWTKDRAKADKLYDAIVNGDTAYLARLKSTYKTDDAYASAVRKVLRENDPRIHQAAQAKYDGNSAEYKRIFREIQGEGKFGFDEIMDAINTEVSNIKKGIEPAKESSEYSATDFVNAVIVGETSTAKAMREDILAYKVANGDTMEEAEESFESSVQTSTRNAFDTGLLDEAGAKKLLTEYAGKDEEEAAEKVGYWAFCKAHPECDLSESNVEKYHEWAEPAEIPLDVFEQYVNGTAGLETIRDEWGDEVKSKREQVLEVIDSLPLTWQQKDALYLAAGYAESKIWDVPW